ncbi:unnamed protein product, partial [Ceratitis capitata]
AMWNHLLTDIQIVHQVCRNESQCVAADRITPANTSLKLIASCQHITTMTSHRIKTSQHHNINVSIAYTVRIHDL